MSGSIGAILLKPYRAIGTIIPDVVAEEVMTDDLAITEHPIEEGAPISDHAYKRPAEVMLRCGWSDSSAMQPGYVNQVYAELLALQASRRPFTLFTGKRVFPNMLIRSLGVQNDARFEHSLMVTARLQQVIIVSTAAVGVPPASAQATPQSTAPTQQNGPVTPVQPPRPSILQGIFGTPAGQQQYGIPPT